MRINEVTNEKLKTPLKVNGNLNLFFYTLFYSFHSILFLSILLLLFRSLPPCYFVFYDIPFSFCSILCHSIPSYLANFETSSVQNRVESSVLNRACNSSNGLNRYLVHSTFEVNLLDSFVGAVLRELPFEVACAFSLHWFISLAPAAVSDIIVAKLALCRFTINTERESGSLKVAKSVNSSAASKSSLAFSSSMIDQPHSSPIS